MLQFDNLIDAFVNCILVIVFVNCVLSLKKAVQITTICLNLFKPINLKIINGIIIPSDSHINTFYVGVIHFSQFYEAFFTSYWQEFMKKKIQIKLKHCQRYKD